MKTMVKGILTLLLAFVVQINFAQEKTVSGIVSDSSGTLPGVSVLIKGTNKGTETDFDGKYSIKTQTGDVLSFSYIGYKTAERTVGVSNTINITLEEGGEVLDEIVVTALGIKREKKSLGVSQQSVKGDALVKAKEIDISNALAGKISGLQIVGNNSSTFGVSTIKLRGESNVLYVVDGVRIYSSSDINADNVADISVLKGGSATALYGPEGRNGVVIITTKRGKKGETTFGIDYALSVNSVVNLPEYQNEYGGGYSQTWNTFSYDPTQDPASWASFDGQRIPEYNADESWGPRLDGTMVRHWDSWIPNGSEFGNLRAWSPTTNDVDAFYNNAITNNTTFSFAKADENYNIRSSVSYISQEGVVPNSKRETTRVAINASYDITDKFEFYANLNYEDRYTLNNPEQNYGNLGSNFNQWWQRQLDFSRLRNYEYEGKVYSWNIKGPRNAAPLYWDMPYFHSYENTKNETKNASFGKIGGNYTFNDNFVLKAEARKTFNSYNFDDRGTTKSLLDPSFYLERATRVKRDEFFAMLSYSNKFMDDEIDLTANAGGEITNYAYRQITGQTVGGLTIPGFYNLAGSKDPASVTTNYSNWKNRGMFVRTSIGYKNMAYLDGSYRLDWRSTANPEDNRVGTYGISASLLAHKLISKNDILSFAKLRAGISTAPLFPSVYLISSTYEAGDPIYQTEVTQSISGTQPNPDLTGGIRQELEIGTEMSFLNNRLSLDFTYFNRDDKDNPVRVALDGATGYSFVYVNAGETTSKGIEFALFGDVIKKEDFRFELGVNFATLSKVVNKISEDIKSRDLSTYTSRMKLQERVGEEWGLFYGTGFAEDANGNRIIQLSGGNYSYAQQKNKYLGSLLPDFTGGLTTNFTYKNMNLNFGFDFQKGGKYYSRTERYYNHSGIAPITVGLNDKGNPKRDPVASGGGIHITGVLQTGTDADGNPTSDGTVVDTYVNPQDWYNLGNLGNIYENNLHDATYFKLRTIRFNYSFDQKIAEKLNLKSASIGAYANNVWLIYSDLPWVDPSELEKRSGINWAENGTLPSTRSLGLNFKLTF
ncbi:MAG: SusC/RagA family TonB-linked outer membrane protein [Polaribacter sp.]